MKQHINIALALVLTLSACGGGDSGHTQTPTTQASGGGTPANKAPVANAGSNQSVEVNKTITLSGSGTDSDGTIASYQWKEGNTVLSNTASLNYTPTTTGTKTLTLLVTDNDGSTHSDSVNVTVTAIPSGNDSDGDGVLDVDDKWPNDASKPLLSTLWGAYGEDWDPAGRLPFVGMAGYRDGTSIPNITRVVADVSNFGATPGVGTPLDTQAFLDAIAHAKTQVSASNHGVIYVPAGIYEVDKLLHLDTSGLILRGAGRDKTEIHFVNHVDGEMRAILMGGNKDSSGKEHNGLNWKHSKNTPDFSTCLDNSNLATKGELILHLEKDISSTFKANLAIQGNRVRVAQWINRQHNGQTPNLVEQIYGGSTLMPKATGHSTIQQEFIATVVNDRTLKMDRPLRWSPTNESYWGETACVSLRDSSVIWETEEIGLENLTVRFDKDKFYGHDGRAKEGITIRASHSWVNNINIINADNAIINLGQTTHNTVSNVILDADRISATYGPGVPYWYQVVGHIGISAYGHDHLVDNFDIRVSFIHDISTKNSQGCVFSNGKAKEMNMDHHRQVIYSSVWTDLDLGVPHRMWDATGDEEEGFQAASFNTFWNITSANPKVAAETPVWPADGNWIRGTDNWGYYNQNYIAVKGLDQKPQPGSYLDGQPYFDPTDIHLEAINGNEIWPSNIYEAQKKAYPDGKLW